MAISTIPSVFYEFAFNADPNQGALPPYWQDLSPRVQFAWSTKRGKQYEWDVNEAGEWDLRLVNNDGALDPSNTGSIFAPNVRLYRQARIRVALAPTQNLAPRVVATGSAVMDPVHDAVSNWWTNTGSGSIAQANYLTAAPSGQTTALAWTTPAATTSANAALYDGVNSGNPTGPVGDDFQVTAGQLYTASRYLSRVASADATVNVTLTIAWFNSSGQSAGSSSVGSAVTVPTVTSWARGTVTGTAPAGAVWGRVSMAITTPASTTATNTIYVTGIQVEQAGAATSWADSGVMQFIITGGAERLPQTWTEQEGTYGTSEPVVVDALGALAVGTLKDPFIGEILALGPNFLYALNDPAGSSQCADIAGKRIAAPVENSPFGVGSLVFGGSIQATTVPTGAFQGTAGPIATFANNPAEGGSNQFNETVVSLHKTTATPGPPQNGNWTRICHFRASTAPTGVQAYMIWSATVATFGSSISLVQFTLVPGGTAQILIAGQTGPVGFSGGANLCDGNWHQFVMSCDGSGNVAIYIDGALATTGSITLPVNGIVADVVGASIQPGANQYKGGMVGDVALIAEFPAVLTAAQVTNLYNSFRTASSGDSSGARIRRILTWIGWSGPTSIDTGQTASMGPASDLTGSTPLDACNAVAVTENGDFYASAAGVPTFKARNARYNQRTPVYTFGEGPPVGTAGEWPCEIAAIEYDPSHLANRVEITQYQGSVYAAQDNTSAQRYYSRTFQRQVNVTSPNEAQDAANYLLGLLKDPHLRPDTIRLHPSAMPGLFAVCVSLEKGMRIRLIKRPPGAPAITADCFVEKLDWTWDPDNGNVYVDVQASSADLTNYWQLAALHTTLNLQANSGQALATINALPDAFTNTLSQSLPTGYSLTFEPGTARQETLALAPGGIPFTGVGYQTAQLTMASNFQFTHPAGSVVCEPLPTGYTDPTTWDASSVIGAAFAPLPGGATSGTNTITVGPLPDSKNNPLGADWNTGDLLWIGPGSVNFEGYNRLHPNVSTAGEGVLPLAAGTQGFTIGLFSAYGSNNLLVTASGSAFQGANVWAVTVAGGAATGSDLVSILKLQAAANLAFTGSFYVRSATTGASPQVQPYIKWYDANYNVVGTTTTGSAVTLTGAPAAAWTRVTASATAPAGAVFARIGVTLSASAPAGAWAFQTDGLQFEQAASASAYQTCPQVLSVAASVPGYSTVTITLANNLANNHTSTELVCDPLPPGVTNPSAVAATARLAY